jgi:hypothetical protein
MHGIIYISNKGFLVECDKEEHLEVNETAVSSRLKRML